MDKILLSSEACVRYPRQACTSGKLLKLALEDRGYDGIPINWGRGWGSNNVLNKPEAVRLASNKKKSLEALKMAQVPTLLVDNVQPSDLPVVGRPSFHTNGNGFYLCRTMNQVNSAPASHFQRYLENAREFRVHIVKGKSIRISEKYGTKQVNADNTHAGGKFRYPHDFPKLAQLRLLARDAVDILGLDFGCVDLLYDIVRHSFFVLEVNTAPSLNGFWLPLVDVYAEAFMTL